jgi:hypothetical protein
VERLQSENKHDRDSGKKAGTGEDVYEALATAQEQLGQLLVPSEQEETESKESFSGSSVSSCSNWTTTPECSDLTFQERCLTLR